MSGYGRSQRWRYLAIASLILASLFAGAEGYPNIDLNSLDDGALRELILSAIAANGQNIPIQSRSPLQMNHNNAKSFGAPSGPLGFYKRSDEDEKRSTDMFRSYKSMKDGNDLLNFLYKRAGPRGGWRDVEDKRSANMFGSLRAMKGYNDLLNGMVKRSANMFGSFRAMKGYNDLLNGMVKRSEEAAPQGNEA